MHIITLLSSQDLDYSQKDMVVSSQIRFVYINDHRKHSTPRRNRSAVLNVLRNLVTPMSTPLFSSVKHCKDKLEPCSKPGALLAVN